MVPSHLVELCRRHALDAVYVFGSRAGEVLAALQQGRPPRSDNPSDIDIGVLPRSGTRLDARERARITMALEELLANARVDLVILPEAPPFLALDIVSGELLAAIDRDRVSEYELYVMRRAGDLVPIERERRRSILAGEAR